MFCLYFLSFLLGSAFASFSLCVSKRFLRNESFVFSRSHCDCCGHPLQLMDLIPVVSYLFLQGKCRYCKTKIPKETFFLELAGGVVFTTILNRYGIAFHTLVLQLLCALFIAISIIDYKSFLIPDGMILCGVFLYFTDGIISVFLFQQSLLSFVLSVCFAFFLGILLLILTVTMEKITKKEMLGGGDIKLYFLCALFVSPQFLSFFLFLSCIFGFLLVLLQKKNRIPFGPCIALAFYLICLF